MDSAALPRPLRAAPTTWRCSELRDLPGHANLLWHARSAASAHAREPPCKLGRPVIRPSIPAVAGLPRQAARRPGARPPLARSRPVIPREWRGRGAAGTYAAVLAQQQRSFIGSGAGAGPAAPATSVGDPRRLWADSAHPPLRVPGGGKGELLLGAFEGSCTRRVRKHTRITRGALSPHTLLRQSRSRVTSPPLATRSGGQPGARKRKTPPGDGTSS